MFFSVRESVELLLELVLQGSISHSRDACKCRFSVSHPTRDVKIASYFRAHSSITSTQACASNRATVMVCLALVSAQD